MSKPDPSQLSDFLVWFSQQKYTTKIFIAGNHDHLFEQRPNLVNKILKLFPEVTYLQDTGPGGLPGCLRGGRTLHAFLKTWCTGPAHFGLPGLGTFEQLVLIVGCPGLF